ncbi:hypothetical protein SLE2022_171720 [Rubroshorea leprosula]
MDSTTTNSQCCPFSIKLWPPGEGSRRVLVERLRNKLTTNSIFTKKYGCLSKEEAEESAQQIEDLAFNTASQLYDRGPDGDGAAAVLLYAKECSKLLLEVLKRGPAAKNDKVLASKKETNMTGDEGALAISEVVKHSPLLEDFRCSSTRVDSGRIALSNALETCSNLKKLDLRENVFGAGVGLSKSLFKHTNLVGLYLSYLNLEDEGAIAIANALKESAPSLEVLEMAGNNITGDAAPALAACIASKQHLTKLNLSENELKGEGATQIGKALEGLAQLKEVDMSNNSMRRAGARMLPQVVIEKPGFKLLNIDGNIISNEGVDEVKEIFKKFLTSLGLWMRMTLKEEMRMILKEEMTVRNLEKDKVKAKLMGMTWSLN